MLRAMGIKVCRVEAGATIEDVVRSFEQDTLREVQGNEACSHHSCS
jgi:predicted Fe-Mo cluster-binding NifX family protein